MADSDVFQALQVDPPGESTAEDLVISCSAYVDEIQAALRRAEQAFEQHDHARTAQLASEGLETIRVSLPKLGAQEVPAHYAAFFHCLCMTTEFREALRLYKQGVAQSRGRGRRDEVDRESLLRAWQLLEPKAACLDAKLQVERLVFEFPVAGRLLRAVLRLRDKLRQALAGAGGG
jgi:hypothetical protein